MKKKNLGQKRKVLPDGLQHTRNIDSVGNKVMIKLVGLCIVLFAAANLLIDLHTIKINQDRVLIRVLPYSCLAIAGIGVINMKLWSRFLIILISFIGLTMQLFELSSKPNLKDLIQGLFFIFLLVLFISNKVGERFY